MKTYNNIKEAVKSSKAGVFSFSPNIKATQKLIRNNEVIFFAMPANVRVDFNLTNFMVSFVYDAGITRRIPLCYLR